jgi:hypothetical protein
VQEAAKRIQTGALPVQTKQLKVVFHGDVVRFSATSIQFSRQLKVAISAIHL